ncbi:MAG: adenylosuccinate lyase [Deinococcales bacterium]
MIDRYSTPEMRRLWGGAARYRAWLQVELAATEAWEALGEVPAGTAEAIDRALGGQPLDDAFAARVEEIEATTRHDIVAFTRAIAERVGEPARFLHMGLTSTDVVDTAQNLLLREALDIVLADVSALSEALREKAVRYKHTPCVGRTHGIHAEPMTFGLKFLNFLAALRRDEARLRQAREAVSVAMLSGSVGTYAHVPPEVEARVAERLGLAVDAVTNQTVARDRHAELMSALAILGTTVERVALEIRHLQRSEVREAQEGFGRGQTGSSSMPHKKNPIASENLTGVARLLRSNLQAALENVALWHERDISHSSVERIILPDSTTLASYALRRLTGVLEALVVDEQRLGANLELLHGLIYSQRVLHKLIDRGLSREAAYEVVQRNSLRSWDEGTHLKTLLSEDPDNLLTGAELDDAFDPGWYLRHVDAIYARFGL